jgi:hypothetical protein
MEEHTSGDIEQLRAIHHPSWPSLVLRAEEVKYLHEKSGRCEDCGHLDVLHDSEMLYCQVDGCVCDVTSDWELPARKPPERPLCSLGCDRLSIVTLLWPDGGSYDSAFKQPLCGICYEAMQILIPSENADG